MRVLAIDHGEKRIGVAISDPSGTIANPLGIIKHVSRDEDVSRIVSIASDHEVGLIIVGQSFFEDGQPNLAGRRAARFAESLQKRCEVPVELWDESFSTQEMRDARIQMDLSRKQRAARLDAQAATRILQTYLDAQITSGS
jgi:putative Holliday junction resolvase